MHTDNSELLKAAYGRQALALSTEGCCGNQGCGSCAPESTEQGKHEIDSAGGNSDPGLSCGNPIEFSHLVQSETVLDLGSGAGRDVFSASPIVGSTGRVIGVDISSAMLELARNHEQEFREEHGLHNTEFREGNIEDLPLFDASVDVVISNCVVNLARDRHLVFREAFRVLKPGGRIVFSDLVIEDHLSKDELALREDAGRVYAGALSCQAYLDAAVAAGFTEVEILKLQRYASGQCGGDPVTSTIQDVMLALGSSLTMSAVKPA